MECLNAYVFTRRLGFMDGYGPVVIIARNLAEARDSYKVNARRKLESLSEFVNQPILGSDADGMIDEELDVMDFKEVPLIPGTIILDQGI